MSLTSAPDDLDDVSTTPLPAGRRVSNGWARLYDRYYAEVEYASFGQTLQNFSPVTALSIIFVLFVSYEGADDENESPVLWVPIGNAVIVLVIGAVSLYTHQMIIIMGVDREARSFEELGEITMGFAGYVFVAVIQLLYSTMSAIMLLRMASTVLSIVFLNMKKMSWMPQPSEWTPDADALIWILACPSLLISYTRYTKRITKWAMVGYVSLGCLFVSLVMIIVSRCINGGPYFDDEHPPDCAINSTDTAAASCAFDNFKNPDAFTHPDFTEPAVQSQWLHRLMRLTIMFVAHHKAFVSYQSMRLRSTARWCNVVRKSTYIATAVYIMAISLGFMAISHQLPTKTRTGEPWEKYMKALTRCSEHSASGTPEFVVLSTNLAYTFLAILALVGVPIELVVIRKTTTRLIARIAGALRSSSIGHRYLSMATSTMTSTDTSPLTTDDEYDSSEELKGGRGDMDRRGDAGAVCGEECAPYNLHPSPGLSSDEAVNGDERWLGKEFCGSIVSDGSASSEPSLWMPRNNEILPPLPFRAAGKSASFMRTPANHHDHSSRNMIPSSISRPTSVPPQRHSHFIINTYAADRHSRSLTTSLLSDTALSEVMSSISNNRLYMHVLLTFLAWLMLVITCASISHTNWFPAGEIILWLCAVFLNFIIPALCYLLMPEPLSSDFGTIAFYGMVPNKIKMCFVMFLGVVLMGCASTLLGLDPGNRGYDV